MHVKHPGFAEALTLESETMKKFAKFSSEVRERAVLMMLKHRAEHLLQSAAIQSIAEKIGCVP